MDRHDAVADALDALGAAEEETLVAAATRVARQRDEAWAELRTLRAIIEGRTTPPTDAEIQSHAAAGGSWLVTLPALKSVRMHHETRLTNNPVEVSRLWWSEGARWVPVRDGRPTAWPEEKP